MKRKQFISAILSAFAAAALTANARGLCATDMDYTADGAVDTFDLIAARKTASKEELLRLNDFILGKPVSNAGYTLIWSDEFDGNELNSDKWSYELGN